MEEATLFRNSCVAKSGQNALEKGGGQRLATLVTSLVAAEIEVLEPWRCPLLEGGGQRSQTTVLNRTTFSLRG